MRVSVTGLMFLASVGTVSTGATPTASAESGPEVATWISGLNAPRGITFDGRGSLYVSESGSAGVGPAGLTTTGRVTKYAKGSTQPVWVHTFESLYATIDPAQPPDVLGPEGISALGGGCRDKGRGHKPDRRSDGCQIRMIVSESHDGVAAVSGGAVNSTQLGHLFSFNSNTGVATDVSNVGDQMYKWTSDRVDLFPSDFPDSNPYGVLITKDPDSRKVRTFVADAGANTISEIMADGTTRVIAFIPNESAPPFRDATPICIAQGPDGMLYVATLHFVANLEVFGSGQSDVWRVDPDADFPTMPTIWASGLTTPTACTFDDEDNFWAAEMFQPNPAGPTRRHRAHPVRQSGAPPAGGWRRAATARGHRPGT